MAGYRDEVQPSITVISPDGDEVWRKDTSHMIAWSSSNLTGNIKIELFQGGILDTTISPDAADTGSFSWTVPQSQSLGSDYRIRISSIALPAIFDEGDGDFTIAEALESKAMPWIPLLVLP